MHLRLHPDPVRGLIFACAQWGSGDLSFFESLGLAITVAMVGGIAINTAHELGHKRKQHEKWLAKVALAQTGYGHFFIEHNRGHHVRVATPEDPASSRLGESFWEFLPRTVWGSLTSALHLEKVRLDRLEKPFFSPQNDVLNAWAMTLVLFAALTVGFGIEVLPWLVVQAVIGASLLEVVNYLEHYGLLRQKREDGRYERCAPEHSWNSDNVASNVFLYHLQRHSDHHANPTRRYQALRHFEQLPELPSGYATMIVLAYATPIWWRVMDPKVLAHYDGDVTKANILPRKREKILAKYGATPKGSTAVGSEAAMATYQCQDCEYVYDEARARRARASRPEPPWADVPDDWCCPDCGVREKVDFSRARGLSEVERATAPPRPGFAEASRGLLRETVLDAVAELLAERSWADVTMAAGRRARRRLPPDALQRVRVARRARPGLRDARGRPVPRRASARRSAPQRARRARRAPRRRRGLPQPPPRRTR